MFVFDSIGNTCSTCRVFVLFLQRNVKRTHIDGNWHIIIRHTPFNRSAALRGCVACVSAERATTKNTSNETNRKIEKFSISLPTYSHDCVWYSLCREPREDVSLFLSEKICRFTFKRIECNEQKRWAGIRKRKEVGKLNWNNNMLIFYSENCAAGWLAGLLLGRFSSLLPTRFSRLFELSTSVSTFSQFRNLLSLLQWRSFVPSFWLSFFFLSLNSSSAQMFIEFQKCLFEIKLYYSS